MNKKTRAAVEEQLRAKYPWMEQLVFQIRNKGFLEPQVFVKCYDMPTREVVWKRLGSVAQILAG